MSQPTTSTAITCHSHYSDPAADITLVSNEGIHFKVSSYYMCKASGLFADMIEAADNTSTPIHFEASAKILETFLGIILAPTLEIGTSSLTIDECFSLLPLCDFFDCKPIEVVLRERLEDLAGYKPKVVFAYSSKVDDLEMAKHAISQMHSLEIDLWELKEASSEYLVALISAIATHLPNADKKSGEHRYTYNLSKKRKHDEFRWQQVIDDFNPKRNKRE